MSDGQPVEHLRRWAIASLLEQRRLDRADDPLLELTSSRLGWAALFTAAAGESALLCHARGDWHTHSLAIMELASGPALLAEPHRGAAVAAGRVPATATAVEVSGSGIVQSRDGWWLAGTENLGEEGICVVFRADHGRPVGDVVVVKRVAGFARIASAT
jgi:hypothetical protein